MFRTKAEDRRHQTHACSPNPFLEVWSFWGLNSRKWMIQNYFTIWELFFQLGQSTAVHLTRVCLQHTAIKYLRSVSAGRDPRPLSFACLVHYTTYSPLLPFAGPHHWRHRTSSATSWWKKRTRRGTGRDSGSYPTAKITVVLERSDRVPRPLYYLHR